MFPEKLPFTILDPVDLLDPVDPLAGRIIQPGTPRVDIDVVYVPANDIAAELGTVKMLNVAALGALLVGRPPAHELKIGSRA